MPFYFLGWKYKKWYLLSKLFWLAVTLFLKNIWIYYLKIYIGYTDVDSHLLKIFHYIKSIKHNFSLPIVYEHFLFNTVHPYWQRMPTISGLFMKITSVWFMFTCLAVVMVEKFLLELCITVHQCTKIIPHYAYAAT